MIGEIRKIITPYYDKDQGRTKFKSRPGLIISETNGYDQDRMVLPVSTIKNLMYRDPNYDLPIKKCDFPLLNLSDDCYIRTGKQVSLSGSSIGGEISDLKTSYPDKYLEVLTSLETYNKNLLEKAI